MIATPAPAPVIETLAELAVPSGPAAGRVVPPRVALVRTRAGRGIVAGSFLTFAALFAVVRTNRSAGIDAAVSRGVQRIGRPAGAVLHAASWPGFPPQSRVIPAALVAALWAAGLRLEAGFQLVAWSGALVSEGLKALARRPRPAAADAIAIVAAPLRGSSFPSGHVLTYIGVYGFLAHVLGAHIPGGRRRALGVGVPLALVGLVGPSRIHAGHHWPTDVLGSYLVGLPLLALLIEGYRVTKERLLAARTSPARRDRGRA
ncbi:MAG TPA: phosphatase PAP2 family protein [Candidatus Limnocylindrales bacterium]|nr:phosphatase PAP2 family protein [Candidatus Limnocylindrales bacterium]